MKIELTEQEILNLLAVLANSNFKGSDWRIVGDLETKLKEGLEIKPAEDNKLKG